MNLIQDVINLEVFDTEGRLITEIKTMKKGDLKYRSSNFEDKDSSSYLFVEDVLLNFAMLEQLGEKVVKKQSDFEESLNSNKETTIKFKNKGKTANLKLIGRGIIYEVNTMEVSHDFKIVIPKVQLAPTYNLNLETGEAHTPAYVFKLNPYNVDGDLFDLIITERNKAQ